MIKKISIVLFVFCSVCMQSAQVQATIVGFDYSIRGLQSFTIGIDIDVSGPVTMTDAIESRGTVEVFEFSFHDGQHLKLSPSDNLILGSSQFDTTGIGSGLLNMAVLDRVGKAVSKKLDADFESGLIAVTSPSVNPPYLRPPEYVVQG
jgi:hypothetical protein